MRNDDVIAQLRAVDPATRTDLSRIDPGALSALREGITMSAPEATKRKRQLGRRGLFVAGVSVVLVGGGAAYAAHVEFFGGDGDGVNCQHVWNETAAGVPMVSGPELTGDPIADCDTYEAQAGQPSIADPSRSPTRTCSLSPRPTRSPRGQCSTRHRPPRPPRAS